MKNQEIDIYSESTVSFYGRIKKGCLSLTSEVYGGDYYPDSEMHLNFTKEQTNKLFSLLSLDDLEKNACQGCWSFWRPMISIQKNS